MKLLSIFTLFAFFFVSFNVLQAAPGRDINFVGSFQSKVGMAKDWAPEDPKSKMKDLGNNKYEMVLNLPAGDWEYKAAVNGSWKENYGSNAKQDGPNYKISLTRPTEVVFVFDDSSKEVKNSINDSSLAKKPTVAPAKK